MCITLENRSAKFNKTAIKNDELRSFANMLAQDAMNIRANLLHMSAIMATIAARREDGILSEFDDSIVTFAQERLGIKKSQVYSMVQVGTTFLDNSGKSLLPEKGGKWSNTQLMALLPMGGAGKNKLTPIETLEACKELVADGKISPDMTVADIKEVVKNERPDAKAIAEKAKARKAKADAKAKVEETIEDSKVEDSKPTIQGTKIGSLEFWQTADGKIHVITNGKEADYDTNFINGVVQMLQQGVTFHM